MNKDVSLFDEEVRGVQRPDDLERNLHREGGVENVITGVTSASDPFYAQANDSDGTYSRRQSIYASCAFTQPPSPSFFAHHSRHPTHPGESPQFSGPVKDLIGSQLDEVTAQRSQAARGPLVYTPQTSAADDTSEYERSYELSTQDEEIRGKQRKDRLEAQINKAGAQNPLDGSSTAAQDPYYGLEDSQDGTSPLWSGEVSKTYPNAAQRSGPTSGYEEGSESSSSASSTSSESSGSDADQKSDFVKAHERPGPVGLTGAGRGPEEGPEDETPFDTNQMLTDA